MDKRLTIWIMLGMFLGVLAGTALYYAVDPAVVKTSIVPWFKLLSDIFLNLIKLLVAPLILSTIVVGIAHMGDSSALGRIGFRAISWFIVASLISISLGLLMVNIFQPGVGAPIPESAMAAVGEVPELKATEFILSVFPKNAFEAMATNNILQILVFSLFAGEALSAMGEKGGPLVRGAEALAEMMLQITGYVMLRTNCCVWRTCKRGSEQWAGDFGYFCTTIARILSFSADTVDYIVMRRRNFPEATILDAYPLYS